MYPAFDPPQMPAPTRFRNPLWYAALTTCLLANLLLTCSDSEQETPSDDGAMMPAEIAAILEPDRGYRPRACGFDLDDDGIVGEAEDCRVCDAKTADPDGDGILEDLIYVDCGSGLDQAGCGTPDNPCASLAWAFGASDGFGDGAEDIVCFRGRCSEEDLRPSLSGGGEIWLEPPAGTALRPWQRRRDPAMVVGWDTDGDGEYPPFDEDDFAELEGVGKGRALRLGGIVEALELAHFRVIGHGRTEDGEAEDRQLEDSGFLSVDPDDAVITYLSVHDLELRGINMERAAGRRVSTFHLSTESSRLHWLDFDHLLATDNGGAFALAPAAGNAPDNGPMRWRNITHTAHGCDALDCDQGASTLVFAFSGHVSGVEIVDSVWDANIDRWLPKAQGGISGAAFVIVARYSQDVLVRNNRIRDHKNGLVVRGGAAREYENHEARPVDGIVFDRNHLTNRFERWKYGDFAVEVRDGEEPDEVVGSVTITNNLLVTTTPWDGCIALRPGSDHDPIPGRILVAHNTCSGPIDRYAALVIGDPEGGGRRNQQQNIVVLNNLLTHLGPRGSNVQTSYSPDGWRADGNVYQDGSFKWSGRFLASLDQWRASSGGDAEARTCQAPLGPALGLSSGPLADDSCARDAGVDPSRHFSTGAVGSTESTTGGDTVGELELLSFDFEGDPRPQGAGWDAGADETSEPSPVAGSATGPEPETPGPSEPETPSDG